MRVKNVTKNKKAVLTQKRLIGLSALAICAVIVANFVSSQALRDTVQVAVLKDNVPQDGVITSANLVPKTLVKQDYLTTGQITLKDGTQCRNMVLWDERKKIVNSYAANYLRKDTGIYYDELSHEIPKSTPYLYTMDGELMKLDISANEFGTLLVPGDRINVRAAYTESDYNLPTEAAYKSQMQSGNVKVAQVTKTEMLCNEASVLDIQNSDGKSIFDIYYNLMSLPESQQQAEMKNADFQKSVVPQTLYLDVTAEEADHNMAIKSKSPTYLMTLLPRTGTSTINDLLAEMQKAQANSAQRS